MTAVIFSLLSYCLKAKIICSSVNLLCFISRLISLIFYKKPLLPHATLDGAQVNLFQITTFTIVLGRRISLNLQIFGFTTS